MRAEQLNALVEVVKSADTKVVLEILRKVNRSGYNKGYRTAIKKAGSLFKKLGH